MKRKHLAILVGLALTHTAFAQDVVVFGDSLSDIGQTGWALKATYNDAQNQPHKLYDELVAQGLGNTLAASTKGGNNYAYSGGVIKGEHSDKFSIQPQVAIDKQIESYLNAHPKADPDALYIVWGGGNDLAAILKTAASTGNSAAALQDVQATAALNAAQVKTLQSAGANLLVAPNTPNVFNTPEFFAAFQAAALGKVRDQLGALLGRAFYNKMSGYFTAAANELSQEDLTNLDSARNKIIEAALDKYWADTSTAGIRSLIEGQGITKEKLAEQFKSGLAEMKSSAATLANLLNGNTNLALRQNGGNIVRLDVDQLFNDMLADPQGYGFNNVVTPACSESSATTLCSQSTGGQQQAAADADSRLFADSFHPGPVAHQIMADYLLATLKAPAQAVLVGQTALGQTRDTWAFARDRSNDNRTQRQAPATFEPIVSAEGGTDSTHNLHVGGKAQWNENWQTGFVYSRLNQHPNSNGMDIKSESNVLTAYARYDSDRWWIGGGIQFADGDYRLGRNIQLGPKHITQRADTNGNTQSAALFGGYEIPVGSNGKVALLAHTTYTRGKIESFVEQEKGATRMSFDKQQLRSLQSGLGAQYQMRFGNVSAYARALFEREWKTPEAVRANMGGLSFTAGKPDIDKNSVNTALGADWQVGSNLHVFGQIGHRFGSSDSAGNTLGQIGLRATF